MIRSLAALLILLAPVSTRALERVVSLNLCTDQMLVLLAPEKVAALSPLARDPTLSYVAAAATSMPAVRASAEAVLRLHPDLVLAARFGAQTTLSVLERERVPVLRVDLPVDFAGIRAQTRQLAGVLGVAQRGELVVASMDSVLSASSATLLPRTAIAWEPRGFVAGPDSMMGAVLDAAGLKNIGVGHWMSAEAVLRTQPDMIVLPEAPGFPSLATDMLRSPALSGLTRRSIPPALTICAGPFTAYAVALLGS
ncbi:MAG: ABC transporter substrate-binding protein [Acetobacteraceae bacterium]|nr:ABC transporter substrate-binding protein [Acetobacteraceae bacterium]